MTLEEKLRAVQQREEAAAAKRRKIAAMIAERDQRTSMQAKIMLANAIIISGFVAEVLGLLPADDRDFVVKTLRLPFSSSGFEQPQVVSAASN